MIDAVVRAYEKLRYAWAVAKAYWRFYLAVHFIEGRSFLVYKVVAVNEDLGLDAVVTRAFDIDDWETTVRLATGWTSARVRADVRYLAHGRKFRMVLRPGDRVKVDVERHRGGPKGVIAAHLVDRHNGGPGVDVTRRVLKYQGPARDFHSAQGLVVGVTELFPYDCPDELVHKYSELVVIDSTCRVTNVPIEAADLALELDAHR